MREKRFDRERFRESPPAPGEPRAGLHARGDPAEVRPRGRRRRRLGAGAPRREAGDAGQRPGSGRGRHHRPRARGDRGLGDRDRGLGLGARGADRRLVRRGRRVRGRRRLRRLRGHRRRVEHRHREGVRPDRHPRRRDHGLRQPAGRRGAQAAVAAEAAAGDPDHLRLGRRGDDGGDPRHPRAEGQDRDLAPLPAAGPGDRRPGADRVAAGRGRRLVRARRDLPCRRVVHRQAVLRARGAGLAGRPAALPGRDADLRHLVGEGARVRRAATCATRSPATRRRAAG